MDNMGNNITHAEWVRLNEPVSESVHVYNLRLYFDS